MNMESKGVGSSQRSEEEKARLERARAWRAIEKGKRARASVEEYAEGLPDRFDDNDQEKAA